MLSFKECRLVTLEKSFGLEEKPTSQDLELLNLK